MFPWLVVQYPRTPNGFIALRKGKTVSDIRILIADRHALFREVLGRLLEAEPDFVVVGDTDNGEMLPSLVAELKPDVLLMDLKLRKRYGLEVLFEITASRPDLHCILLTDSIEMGEIIQALLQGARGIVQKESPPDLLFKSIRAVRSGQYWIARDSISALVRNLQSMTARAEQSTQLQARSLSRQQRQIVEAIVSGCTNREIAEELRISERTVKYHLTRIFSKLGVSGRMELARFSLKNNVLAEAHPPRYGTMV
jgi:DNA-binding NarL/FixJ family response regulator